MLEIIAHIEERVELETAEFRTTLYNKYVHAQIKNGKKQ